MNDVLLKDICLLIVDCPHSTAYDEGKGYPLVRTPNIGKGRLIYQGMHRVSEDVYHQRNQRAVPQEGDLIFAREATAGNVAQIQPGEKVCLGQRTVLIRPNREIVDSAFLTYFLLAPKQQYNLLSTANGATVAHVNMPTIRNLKLSIPDLPTQKRIASILSAYDDLIEVNRKQIKLLEEAAERLYREWFIELRFPGHEQATFNQDGLPNGWKKGIIADLGEFRRGKTITRKDARDGNVPVVAGGITPAYYTNKSNTEAPVITISASGNAGFANFYYEKIWASDCSYLDNTGTEFIYFMHCLIQNNQTAIYNFQKGSCQQHVNAKQVNSLEVIVPDKNTIALFENRCATIFEKIASLDEQSKQAAEARDLLLPRLMNGEIQL